MKRYIGSFLTASLLAGCATGPTPQTAQEYRVAVANGGFGVEQETYVVNRPYSLVAKTLKAKSKECLDVKLLKQKCILRGVHRNCQDYEVFYRPTVVNGKGKTSLQVQWRRDPWDSAFMGGAPPANGVYIAVFDIEPAGKEKSKVTAYGPSIDHLQTVPTAVKGWIDGTQLSCPDLTQPYYY